MLAGLPCNETAYPIFSYVTLTLYCIPPLLMKFHTISTMIRGENDLRPVINRIGFIKFILYMSNTTILIVLSILYFHHNLSFFMKTF